MSSYQYFTSSPAILRVLYPKDLDDLLSAFFIVNDNISLEMITLLYQYTFRGDKTLLYYINMCLEMISSLVFEGDNLILL